MTCCVDALVGHNKDSTRFFTWHENKNKLNGSPSLQLRQLFLELLGQLPAAEVSKMRHEYHGTECAWLSLRNSIRQLDVVSHKQSQHFEAQTLMFIISPNVMHRCACLHTHHHLQKRQNRCSFSTLSTLDLEAPQSIVRAFCAVPVRPGRLPPL